MTKYIISFKYELETDEILPEVFLSGPGSLRVLSTVQFVNTLLDQIGVDKIAHACISLSPMDELADLEETSPDLNYDWAVSRVVVD